MSKYRVLQVIGTLHIGGAENAAMNLYRYIDRRKFEFDYLVYYKDGEYENEVRDLGGRVIYMDGPHIDRRRFSRRLLKVIKENGPYDIIHSHLLFHNGLVLKCAYKAGIKNRICHSHSTSNGNLKKSLMHKIYQMLMRQYIFQYSTDYWACGVEAGNYLFGTKNFANKGITINNGIDVDLFDFNKEKRTQVRLSQNWENNYVYALPAHFEEAKNHTFLIDIFGFIHELQENAILVLFGEGTLKKETEKKVKDKGLSNCVYFTGNVSNMHEYLQGVDMVIMPSLYEGLPFTLIEAQAAGIRCVASENITGESDISGLVKFIPLSKTAECCAKEIIEYSQYDRISTKTAIQDAGYDVRKNMYIVEEKYLGMIARNKTD